MINEVADKLVAAAELLVKFSKTEDSEKRREIYRSIKKYESESDALTDRIYSELNNSFITPFDREDIHNLCEALDDTLDGINSSSKRMLLFNPKHSPESMVEMCRIILYSCKAARIAVGELKHCSKHPKVALEQCALLHDYEQTGDELYEEFIKTYFASSNTEDVLDLIKNKEIMQELEGTTDFAKVIGKNIKTIIVKYA